MLETMKNGLLKLIKFAPKYDVVFTNDEFTKTLFEKRKISVISVVLKDREKFSGTNIRNLITEDKNWRDFGSTRY